MVTCSICEEKGIFKIRGEKIYYCKEHAKEFFDEGSLEQIEQIKLSVKQADILKKYILGK